MIELRWLIFEGGHKVLQQRTNYTKESWVPEGSLLKEQVWTDWVDVPQHLCAIVNGERKVLERAL